MSPSAPEPVTQYSGQPALEPPDGQEPQFDDPPNRNTAAYAGISICIIFVSLCFITRVTCLAHTRKRPKIEDYLALASVTLFFAYQSIALWFVEVCGAFVHQWDIHAEDMPLILYIIHVDSIIYEATMVTVKVAILIDWIRIFVPPGTRDWFWWTGWGLLSLISMYYFSCILTFSFSCIPHEKIWYPDTPGHCSDTSIIFMTTSSINLVSDLMLLILPQSRIWGLNLTWKKRFRASLAFSIGLMACVSAAVRIWASWVLYHTEDTTYHLTRVSQWCMAEMTCAYLVLCLPYAPSVYGPKGCVGKYAVKAGLMSSGATSDPASSSSQNRYYQVDDALALDSVRRARPAGGLAGPNDGIMCTSSVEATLEAGTLEQKRVTATYDPRW